MTSLQAQGSLIKSSIPPQHVHRPIDSICNRLLLLQYIYKWRFIATSMVATSLGDKMLKADWCIQKEVSRNDMIALDIPKIPHVIKNKIYIKTMKSVNFTPSTLEFHIQFCANIKPSIFITKIYLEVKLF